MGQAGGRCCSLLTRLTNRNQTGATDPLVPVTAAPVTAVPGTVALDASPRNPAAAAPRVAVPDAVRDLPLQSHDATQSLQKLVDLGFAEKDASIALVNFGGNLDRATNYLVDVQLAAATSISSSSQHAQTSAPAQEHGEPVQTLVYGLGQASCETGAGKRGSSRDVDAHQLVASVHVIGINGESLFDVDSDAGTFTVAQLLRRARETLGVVQQCELIGPNGSVLNEDALLGECGLQEGAILTAVAVRKPIVLQIFCGKERPAETLELEPDTTLQELWRIIRDKGLLGVPGRSVLMHIAPAENFRQNGLYRIKKLEEAQDPDRTIEECGMGVGSVLRVEINVRAESFTKPYAVSRRKAVELRMDETQLAEIGLFIDESLKEDFDLTWNGERLCFETRRGLELTDRRPRLTVSHSENQDAH